MSDMPGTKPGRVVTAFTHSTGVSVPPHGLFVADGAADARKIVEDATRLGIAYPLEVHLRAYPPSAAEVCPCGSPLMFSARARGDGLCGPCSRGASFRTIAATDRLNHDPGDEDR